MALSAAPVPRCRPDARLAQAKKDLTEVTHKVYFDIEIDSKPAGAWNKGKYRRMEHDSKLSVPSGFQEHDLKLSGAWNKGKLSVPSLCLLNLELMLHPLWLSRSGPFNFESGGSAGSLPKLHRNPYSWSKVSSVIYLDSPAGVDLSYAKDKSKPYTTGDLQTAHDLHTFLLKWFQLYHEFLTNPFYIAGESYAGIYIPTLSHEVVKGIHERVKPAINFKVKRSSKIIPAA